MSSEPDIAIVVGPDGLPEPRHASSGLPVSAIVHACHEQTVDQALASLDAPGLSREMLEPLLVYCAELGCEAARATCPGCKRRPESQGIETFDQFVVAHREIVVGDGTIRIAGQGERVLATPSLTDLERSWAGVSYWFWARRVLRKFRHGIRRAHIAGEAVGGPGASPSVLLMEPQLADNIGMVARAMANFGLDDLRLINPRDGWPNEKARIAASGANYVIDDATAHSTLAEAIGDLNFVVATTARQRPLRKPVLTPEEAISEMRQRIAVGERCGILFGRERNGLETGEVAVADALVMIPVNSRFASLNLAQAVLLLGYGWMRDSGQATLGRVTTYETPKQPGLNLGRDRPATKEEVTGFFEHLEQELDRLGFFVPVEKRPSMVQNMRTMFTRMAPTEQEVRSLRGIVATLSKGKGQGRKSST